MEQFERQREAVEGAVQRGATAVFLEIPDGEFRIASRKVTVESCGMGARHFVSRKTGHSLTTDFKANDFFFWYDPSKGYVTPLLERVFSGDGFAPILTSGNGHWQGDWKPAMAAGERRYGQGLIRICQIELAGRVTHNPVARSFAQRLLGQE